MKILGKSGLAVLMAVGLLGVNEVLAKPYYRAAVSEDGDEWFVEMDTIEFEGKGTGSYWTVLVSQKADKGYAARRYQLFQDCRHNIYEIRQDEKYVWSDRKLVIKEGDSKKNSPRDVAIGYVSEGLQQAFCVARDRGEYYDVKNLETLVRLYGPQKKK